MSPTYCTVCSVTYILHCLQCHLHTALSAVSPTYCTVCSVTYILHCLQCHLHTALSAVSLSCSRFFRCLLCLHRNLSLHEVCKPHTRFTSPHRKLEHLSWFPIPSDTSSGCLSIIGLCSVSTVHRFSAFQMKAQRFGTRVSGMDLTYPARLSCDPTMCASTLVVFACLRMRALVVRLASGYRG